MAEKNGKIHCVDACTTFWAPVLASPADVQAVHASFSAKLSVVKRPDGESQLTLNARPLYTFAEEGAHQLKGDGFTDDFQGRHFVWSAATTSGSTGRSAGPGGPTGQGNRYGY
ncbi:MAG TPA: hypothetical protein VFI30_05170 [Nocardioidaceae bacterium]|nr:hypothetical protein [Nocardioidaceae bacterium]